VSFHLLVVAYNLRFPGQYYQPESGLNQNLNRDYDPLVARYAESDPIGLDGGINTYAYSADDPTDRNDASGLFSVKGGVPWPSPALQSKRLANAPYGRAKSVRAYVSI
jgi:RHS repeat-associated protein